MDPSYFDEEEGMTPSPSPSFAFPSAPGLTRAPVLASVPRMGGGNAYGVELGLGLGIDVPELCAAELKSSYRPSMLL